MQGLHLAAEEEAQTQNPTRRFRTPNRAVQVMQGATWSELNKSTNIGSTTSDTSSDEDEDNTSSFHATQPLENMLTESYLDSMSAQIDLHPRHFTQEEASGLRSRISRMKEDLTAPDAHLADPSIL